MKKRISIPSANMQALERYLQHDEKKIIPTYEGIGRTDESKVRLDRKAECACSLGIIEDWLLDEIIEFTRRETLYIHAEIRKSLAYELELSRNAYRRLQPFRDQIVKWQRDQET